MIKKAEEYLGSYSNGKLDEIIKQAQIDIAKDVWQAALTASKHDVKYCKYNNIPATIEEYLKMKGLENES